MKLSMTLETRLDQKLEQKLRHEQRAELRMGLTQRLQQSMMDCRDGVVGPPEDMLETVIQRALSFETNEPVRSALESVFQDEGFRRVIIRSGADLMRPTGKNIEECILRYFFDAHHGEFSLSGEEEAERAAEAGLQSSKPIQLPFALFARAVQDPEETRKEMEIVKEGMKKDSSAEATQHYDELNESLRVADAAREHLELLESALTRLLQLRDPNQDDAPPLVREFLKEKLVFDRLAFTISERMEKRFAASFARAKRGGGERLHEAFLNTVGEYTLVSCGVLDPELFQLQRRSIDEGDVSGLREGLAEIGVNYDALCKQYALKPSGKLLWNRWKTLEVQPGPETDGQVRDFITRSVRLEKDALLAAADYEGMFNRICDEKEELCGSSVEERAQFQDELRNTMVDVLSGEGFKKKLKELIVSRWYPEIEKFMKKTETAAE